MWCPTKNLGPIGSAVLTFIGYKQTDKQTNKQTDKPNLYIDWWVKNHILIIDIFSNHFEEGCMGRFSESAPPLPLSSFFFIIKYRVLLYHIRPFIVKNCDFRDLSEKSKRLNHQNKLCKANIKICIQKILGFSSSMSVFWR